MAEIVKTKQLPKKNYSGKKYNYWTILDFVGWYYSGNRGCRSGLYRVQCDCGEVFERVITDIVAGASKSCKACGVSRRYSDLKNRSKGNTSPAWRGTKDIPRAAFTKAGYSAKLRSVEFSVNIEDLQKQWERQEGICPYTGRVMIFNNKTFKSQKQKIYNFASLDRIDSTKGYTPENIQWVCICVNIMKNAYGHDDFINLIKEIHYNVSK